MRTDSVSVTEWWKMTENLAHTAGATPSLPRQCGRMRDRCNVPSDNLNDYYKKALFLPFLDHLISELGAQFTGSYI